MGGQVGPDGHRPQLEEWRQYPGLRWQDGAVICCCLACIKLMLQGSKKSGGKNGFGIVFLALHELLAHDGFTIFLGSGYGMVLAQGRRAELGAFLV